MVLLRLASGRRRSISAIASESVIQDGHRQVSTALVGRRTRGERKRGKGVCVRACLLARVGRDTVRSYCEVLTPSTDTRSNSHETDNRKRTDSHVRLC